MILKPTELRIGNWVNYPFGGPAQIRSGLDIDTINEAGGMGVEITDAWLLELGIGIENQFGEREMPIGAEGFKVVHNQRGFFLDREGDVIAKIEYIHQLQNLIHALTGQEL